MGRIFAAASPDVTPPPGARQRVLDAMRDRFNAGKSKPSTVLKFQTRRWIWKSSAAAAASLLIVGVAWWLLAGNVRSASAAYGDMVQKVRSATTLSYDMVAQIPGWPTDISHVTMTRRQIRFDNADGTITATDWSIGRLMKVNVQDKRFSISKQPRCDADCLAEIRTLVSSSARYLGKDAIDGQQVWVYDVSVGQLPIKVWLDPQRELPVKIEQRKIDEDGREMVLTLSNMVWNQPITSSLFTLQAPAGYEIFQPDLNPTEKDLVTMLEIVAGLSPDGAFPEEVDRGRTLEKVLKIKGTGSPDLPNGMPSVGFASSDETRAASRKCMPGFAFIDVMIENGSWHYAPRGARLGDAQSPVCWWHEDDAVTWRVLYGDLTIEDVPQEEVEYLDEATTAPATP